MTQPRRILWLTVFAAAGLLLPSRATAQSGTVTDDGFVSTNSTTQAINLNGQGFVLVAAGSSATFNSAPVGTTKAYIKFQLQSSLPPNLAAANVEKATLKLFLSSATNPSGAIDIYPVTSAWTESTLNPSSPPTIAATAFATGIAVGKANSFLVVDVTQLVQEWLNGPSNGGLANDGIALVADTSTSYVVFDSKESIVTSHEPRLEIVLANSGAQGPAGPQGSKGATGPAGSPGPAGAAGAAATIKVEPTMTVPYGTPASVMNAGTPGAADLTFLIPQGPAGINNRGQWTGSNSYNVNDAVTDNGSYWLTLIATSASTSCEPAFPPSPCAADWQLLAAAGAQGQTGAQGPAGSQGPQGAQGIPGNPGANGTNGATGAQGPAGPVGINNRGLWSSANSYSINDAVSDGGAYWLAIAATSASNAMPNTSCEPAYPPSPCSSAVWQLLAAAGAAGTQGATGAAGQSVVGSAEPVGANCAYGGAKFIAVNGTAYACNGVPGAPGQSVTTLALPVGDPNCPFGGTQFITASGTSYACSGGASVTFRTISGTLQGLAATTNLVLRNNGTDDLTLSSNGAFTFATPLAVGSTYAVTVATQPVNGTCGVVNGTGTVGGSNVTNILVNCVVPIVLTTLASGQDHPAAIAVDGTTVYFANLPPTPGGAPGVMTVPLAGGTPTVLAASAPAVAITLDLNNLYFTANDSLYRFPKGAGSGTGTGTGPSQIASGLALGSVIATFPPYFGVVVDAQNAYLTAGSGPAVEKVILTGTNAFSSFAPATAGQQPFAIAADDVYVYWTVNIPGGQGKVMKAPKAGGNGIELASGQNFPAGIAIDANNVYWTNNLDGTVMSVPFGGGTPTVIASGQSFPFGIAVDGTNVYWTNNGTNTGGTVMKAPKSGAGSPTVIASRQNFPLGIAVDATSVYWTNNLGGTVMKASK